MVAKLSGKAEKREASAGNEVTLREVLAAQDLQPFGGWGDFLLKCEWAESLNSVRDHRAVNGVNQHGNQHPSLA